jgi:hypothetical protein
MFRRDRTTLYAEAADPRGHPANELTSGQRAGLAGLGWRDPKADPIPYPDAQYAEEWTGGNLARELPLELGSDAMARTIVTTLAEVYGAEGDAPLEVHVFDAGA